MSRIKSNFKKLNKARKFIIIFLCLSILSTQIVSICILHSIFSLEYIIGSIKFPNGYVDFNMDIYQPENMSAEIPYKIENPSLFSISNIILDVKFRVNYIDQNTNGNISLLIYSKIQKIKDCNAFCILDSIFEGDFSDYIIENLTIFYDSFDILSPIYYYIDFNLRAKYFYELINFRFSQNNLNLFSI